MTHVVMFPFQSILLAYGACKEHQWAFFYSRTRIGWDSALHLSSFRDLWLLPQHQDEASLRVRSTIITAITWNIWKAPNNCAIVADINLWVHWAKRLPDGTYLKMWSSAFVI